MANRETTTSAGRGCSGAPPVLSEALREALLALESTITDAEGAAALLHHCVGFNDKPGERERVFYEVDRLLKTDVKALVRSFEVVWRIATGGAA